MDDVDRDVCDAPLTLPEITDAVSSLKHQRSPGGRMGESLGRLQSVCGTTGPILTKDV